MVWNVFFVFVLNAWLGSSMEGYYQPPKRPMWGYFTPPVRQRVPMQPCATPMEAMVDLTNNLGVAILQDHSYSKGNFAFSPYGVASVLVVLYEGAKGESARQIHRAVKFPSNKEIIRIGFRDMHRHLRSYFSHEGYLSGINLNKKTSSLTPEYKKILRFYGYDVDLNQTFDKEQDEDFQSTSSEVSPSTTPISPLASSNLDSKITSFPHNDSKSTTVSQHSEKENTKKVEHITEPSPHISNTTEQQSKGTTITVQATTIIAGLDQDVTKSPSKDEEIPKTDRFETESVKITTESLTAKTKPGKQEEAEINGKQNTDDVKKDRENTKEEVVQNMDISSTPVEDQEAHTEGSSGYSVTPLETETTEYDRVEEVTNLKIDNGMLIPQLDDLRTTTAEKSITTEVYTSTLDITEQDLTETIAEGVEKTTRSSTQNNQSVIEERNQVQARNDIKLSKEVIDEKFIRNIRNIVDTRLPLWLQERKKTSISRKIRTIADYLKSPENRKINLQLQNGMYDSHVSRNADLYRSLPRLSFLVDGAADMPVPMMSSTNVFPYAYIPRLHAKALKFPLDDIRYKLLILLPVERRGLRQLIYDLGDFPLRNVLECLRPSRVKVTVPTFMVEGFVILTSSLQKLGIWDVFDPRKANLSGMSTDPELYVRNVEQSVTVVIRNYVEILDIQTRENKTPKDSFLIQLRKYRVNIITLKTPKAYNDPSISVRGMKKIKSTMAARHIDYEFDTTHPFLYFVLDEVTNVALMAGQILDPLNSRIY